MARSRGPRTLPRPPTDRSTAAILAATAAAAYLIVAYLSARTFGPGFTLTGDPLSFALLYYGFAVLAVGVPVGAWARFGLRSPVVVLVAALGFWHGLGVLGTGGETPVFALALVWAPVYAVAYAAIAGVERGVPRVARKLRT